MVKHAVFVYQLPQAFSFPAAPGIFDGKILRTLQSEIDSRHLNWDISADDTEGDFSILEKRNCDLIICPPSWGAWLKVRRTDLSRVIVLTIAECYQIFTKYRTTGLKRILDFMEENQDQQ